MTTMNIYLTIMVTILVCTQVIRIIQNAASLRKQNKLIRAEIERIGEVTDHDIEMQREAYRLIVKHFKDVNNNEKIY